MQRKKLFHRIKMMIITSAIMIMISDKIVRNSLIAFRFTCISPKHIFNIDSFRSFDSNFVEAVTSVSVLFVVIIISLCKCAFVVSREIHRESSTWNNCTYRSPMNYLWKTKYVRQNFLWMFACLFCLFLVCLPACLSVCLSFVLSLHISSLHSCGHPIKPFAQISKNLLKKFNNIKLNKLLGLYIKSKFFSSKYANLHHFIN